MSWLEMHPSALHGALIRVVQVAQDRHRPYRPFAVPGLRWWRFGACLPNSLVWSRLVEVRDILLEHAGELTFAEDKQEVQALASYAPQAALARSVGPQGADGHAQHPDPACGGHLVEALPVLAAVVPDQDIPTGSLLSRV